MPRAGQRFDLFDRGGSSGRFVSLDASGLMLGDGLVLDTSQLDADGSIAISTVPEAAARLLMVCAVAAIAVRRRG